MTTNISTWGEDFYILTADEYADLDTALRALGTNWALDLLASFRYQTNDPNYSGMYLGRLSELDDTEDAWLMEHGFVYDYDFFAYSQFPTATPL